MAMTSGLRDYVVAARKRLKDGREQLKLMHISGAPGRSIVSGMSDLTDAILLGLIRQIVENINESSEDGYQIENEVAVVLHGGSGRRDMAPFSDIDMMLLCRQSTDPRIPELASRLSQDIFDTGFQLGQSVRTPREAWSMALKDASVFSSLTESRFLSGNLDLYSHFFSRLRRIAFKNPSGLIRSMIEARQEERAQFGETVYLLRPNIKKSRGGMRDVHLVRWLGFIKYGETDIDQLCRKNAISKLDASRMNQSYEFLLRIRNEMQFNAGRAHDGLGKTEQVRISETFGFKGHEGVLPVEEFMRQYFDHTTDIRHVADQFVASLTMKRSLAIVLSPLLTKQVDNKFEVGPYFVGVEPSQVAQVSKNFEDILRMMQLSNMHDKDIEQETWEAIRHSMIESKELPLTVDAASLFVSMFNDSRQIGRSIRKLHEMRVLERILPEVKHARNLMQFNEYHQYTVDEHSIQAVEMVNRFYKDKGRLGKIYRSLREKNLLNLALLMHDLGKGYAEEHCEVGRRLTDSIGKRLQMNKDDIEELKYLVHNHLMMSHVAFRRDINDESMVAEFAANVGSVKTLKLLYLLTCADISAVGPGVLNQWKLDLLTDLYYNAKNVLTGHHGPDGFDQRLENTYQSIGDLVEDVEVKRWILQQARNLPRNYCRQIAAEIIVEQLMAIRDTIGDEVQCWVIPAEGQLLDICIGKREKRRSGIFYKITGMLANNGCRILNADIKHLSNSLVWYWFRVRDIDFDETTSARMQHLVDQAKGLATGNIPEIKAARKTWKKYKQLGNPRQSVRIELDNQTVQTATVIDVFAFRKYGLLFTMAKEIFGLGLDVRFARISTYGERIVNVFYVTDEFGNKIRDRKKLVEIQDTLLKATNKHLGIKKEASDCDGTTNQPGQSHENKT